ncbi:MAG: lytic transglycosylase domain-containing protein [Verrucomicrobiota bacterium]
MLRRFTIFLFVAVSLIIIGGFWWFQYEKHRISRFEDFITTAAERYKLDANLIRAVIWRESDFNPDALGAAGERGLMQITEAAGSEWASHEKLDSYKPTDLLDPRNNILAGSWYLSRALRRWKTFDTPEAPALAEYNAGPSNAKRWNQKLTKPSAQYFLEQVDYPTTKAYIQDILHKYEFYGKQTNPSTLLLIWEKLRIRYIKAYHAIIKPSP